MEEFIAYYSQGKPDQWQGAVEMMDSYMAASYLAGTNIVYRSELEVLRTILGRNVAAVNRLRFKLYGVLPPGTTRLGSYPWPTMLNGQRFRDQADQLSLGLVPLSPNPGETVEDARVVLVSVSWLAQLLMCGADSES